MEIKSITPLFNTKWLSLQKAIYIGKEGKELQWEYVSRSKKAQVVTIICHSRTSKKYLLISQPRVPVNKIVIEFPAGLVDEGEDLAQAALRELKEETGYTGIVKKIHPFIVKSAGLSDEIAAAVEIEIDESVQGVTAMESTEEIQTFWISKIVFKKFITTADPTKIIADAQVWFYFLGLLSRY